MNKIYLNDKSYGCKEYSVIEEDIKMKKIAVEKGLNPVKSYLHQEGYNVREFDSTKKNASSVLNKFDAVIVTGENSNFMGIQNSDFSATIINADGLTPRDIKSQLERNNSME